MIQRRRPDPDSSKVSGSSLPRAAAYNLPVVFEVPGIPVPKGRPRFTRQGRAYTPKKTREYEKRMREIAEDHFDAPLEGPLCLEVWAYWPARKPHLKRSPRPEEWHSLRPDADNIAKICDALDGVAWRDDSQVAALRVWKRRAAQGEAPRVVVSVARLVK